MTPFTRGVDDKFRGRRVRVRKSTPDGEVTASGYLLRADYDYQHALLVPSPDTDAGSDQTKAVFNVDEIELLDPPQRTMEVVSVDSLKPSPYAAHEFEYARNADYLRSVREHGRVKNIPTIFETDDGYQLVDGHKTLWVCQQTAVSEQQVEVEELTPWEAAVRFAFEHYPTPSEHGMEPMDGNLYDLELLDSLAAMYDDWGVRIAEIPPAEYALETFHIDVDEDEPPFEVFEGEPKTFTYSPKVLVDLLQRASTKISDLEGGSRRAVLDVADSEIQHVHVVIEPADLTLELVPEDESAEDLDDDDIEDIPVVDSISRAIEEFSADVDTDALSEIGIEVR